MNPEERQQKLQAWIEGTLPESERLALEADLLREGDIDEAEALHRLWMAMGELPDEAPSPRVRARFYTMLHAKTRPGLRERLETWIASWWPQQPVYQLAYSLGVLVIGLALGYSLWSDRPAQQDAMATLRQEVNDLNVLVALSLLQQPSASERLKGVGWVTRVANEDDGLLEALLNTVQYDENVNVRLAAVDALAAHARQEQVREGLVAALEKEESPLVQMALIDLIVAAQADQARKVLWQMVQNDTLATEVRQRAREASGEL